MKKKYNMFNKFLNKARQVFFPNWVVIDSKSGIWSEKNELITFMGDKMTKYDTDSEKTEYHWNIKILYSDVRNTHKLLVNKFIGGLARNKAQIDIYQKTLFEFNKRVDQLNGLT